MSPKPALAREPSTVPADVPRFRSTVLPPTRPHRISGDPAKVAPLRPTKEPSFQPRVPVITGEAHYRGMLPVDGIITGSLGASSALAIKQRSRPNAEEEPELNGEITFKDVLRVNGYIAGKVFSYKGTLIVDNSARVDAEIDVAVCVVSGTINGNVNAQQRVELGPNAIINGDISTGSLAMKPGAIFTGNCKMIKDEKVEE